MLVPWWTERRLALQASHGRLRYFYLDDLESLYTHTNVDLDALRSLEDFCANATSQPDHKHSHRPPVHPNNTTATTSGTVSSTSPVSLSHKPPMSPLSGLASSEGELNPSFLALLGVIAATMAML